MVIFRKKYRHDKQRLDEACGLNGAEVLERMLKLNIDTVMKGQKVGRVVPGSKVVEMYEKNFTKRELAFLLFYVQNTYYKIAIKHNMMAEALNELYGGDIEDEDEPSYIM